MKWIDGWSPPRLGSLCVLGLACCTGTAAAQELIPAESVSLERSVMQQETDSAEAAVVPAIPDVPIAEEQMLPPVVVQSAPNSGDSQRDYDATFSNAEVITPNETPTEMRKFGGTVRVVSREQIEQSDAYTVGEILARQPGVDVVNSGGPGGVRSIFLRGANSQHTKVMIDGSPANDPSSPSRGFDAANLTLDNVERIEILQGPQSLLYGSEAIGGVVNIITRRGQGPMSGAVNVQGGSYQTHREGGFVQGSSGAIDYSFSGSWLDTQSFSAAAGGAENDPFEVGALAGAFGVQLTENTEFVYRLRYTDSRAHIDDASFSTGIPPTDDPFRIYLSKNMVQRFEINNTMLDGNITNMFAYDYVTYERNDKDDFFPSNIEGATRQFTALSTALLWPDHEFSVGVQHWDESATTEYLPSPPDSASQYQTGIFFQDQLTLWDRLHLTGGVRWDDHSEAGPHSTYRTTAAYELRETNTRLRASLGTGYRAPALSENVFPYGNPALKPEESTGWEYGVDQSFFDNNVVFGATYFRNDYRNLIIYDPMTFTLLNVGRARSHGIELTTDWYLTDQWTVWASYTHTDTWDADTDKQLLRRPRDKGTFGVTRYYGNRAGSITMAARMIGRRIDSRDGSVVLPNYNVIDLYGDYWIRPNMRWIYKVDNLFNEQYEEITGYATADASLYSGIEWTF
ncbi:TonB-dependent receptor [Bremerella sp. JC817]|uniref:TonB-dependent receptor plug domain-containing protein n=1 Tax=Bremerella sp. JC817 TaxID=3231756 RepID=UPI00345B1BC7